MASSSLPPPGIQRGYSRDLECLRGIAILLVFLYHVHFFVPTHRATAVSPLAAFVHAGHTGVTLFFVLSAFLLSRPFLAEASGAPPTSIARFWKRRALRILPLYATAVVLATLWNGQHPGNWGMALRYLLFLNSRQRGVEALSPFSEVWWSLATEAQFYLLLPIGVLLARRRRGRWLLLALGAAYGLAYAAYAARPARMEALGDLSLRLSVFGRGPAFLAGIAAAWLYGAHGARLRAGLGRMRWMRVGGSDLVLVALVLGQGLLLARVASLGFFRAEVAWLAWHVYEATLWAAALLVLLVAPLRLRPLVVNRGLEWIGLLSYSMYLWHFAVLSGVIRWGPRLPSIGAGWTGDITAVALAGLAGCVAISALTYRAIERPFLVRKDRVAR